MEKFITKIYERLVFGRRWITLILSPDLRHAMFTQSAQLTYFLFSRTRILENKIVPGFQSLWFQVQNPALHKSTSCPLAAQFLCLIQFHQKYMGTRFPKNTLLRKIVMRENSGKAYSLMQGHAILRISVPSGPGGVCIDDYMSTEYYPMWQDFNLWADIIVKIQPRGNSDTTWTKTLLFPVLQNNPKNLISFLKIFITHSSFLRMHSLTSGCNKTTNKTKLSICT